MITRVVRKRNYSSISRAYGGGGGGGGQKDLASEARAIHILAIDLKITFKARFVSGKLIIQARLDIQVDASPKVISNDRSILGTTSRGSVSVNDNNPNEVLHFHILGSTDFGGVGACTTGLGKYEPL